MYIVLESILFDAAGERSIGLRAAGIPSTSIFVAGVNAAPYKKC
jgi:hypothetical protein